MTRTGMAPRLLQHAGEPYLEIHSSDADRLGLGPAALVEVTSLQGRALLRVKISDHVAPGHPFAPMHRTGQTAPSGLVDRLVAAVTDPVSGEPASISSAVAITPFAAAWYGFAVSRHDLTPACAYWAKAPVAGGWQLAIAGAEVPADWRLWAGALFGIGSTAALSDPARGLHRFAFGDQGRLTGAVFVSHDPVLVSRGHLAGVLGQPDPGPTVCACLTVGLNTILRAIASGTATSAEALGAALGAGTNCGSGRPELAARNWPPGTGRPDPAQHPPPKSLRGRRMSFLQNPSLIVPAMLPPKAGRITLVGAGPGAADLLTLRAVRCLGQVDVVFYDRLVDPAVLDHARDDTERVFVGKELGAQSWPQPRIDAAIVADALAERQVVQLKSGDPSIFGRASEEIAAARAHGIAIEVIAGVTAASAAAASLCLPRTERGVTDRVVLATATCRPGEVLSDIADIARPGATLVSYMAMQQLASLAGQLVAAGVAPDHPAVIAADVSRDHARHLVTTVQAMAADCATARLANPAVILISLAKQVCAPSTAAAQALAVCP
jgi:uroporphyrin-III C-methyltransferase